MKRLFDRAESSYQRRHAADCLPVVYLLVLFCTGAALADVPAFSRDQAASTNNVSSSASDSNRQEPRSNPRGKPGLSEALISPSELLATDGSAASAEERELRAKLQEAFQKRREKD